MSYCRIFACLLLLLVSTIGGLFLWASSQVGVHANELLPARREMVRRLQLTDLAIWTEARYARHPSQADLFTPFQEFPGAAEHFPSGSLLAPPPFNLTTQIQVHAKAGAAR